MVLGFLILVVAILFSSLIKQDDLPNVAIPNSNIPSFLMGDAKIPIKLDLTNVNTDFPSELPLLIVGPSNPTTLEESNQIATSLGFSGEPLNLDDIQEGTTYLWQNPSQILTIYTGSNKLEYSMPNNLIPNPNKISDEALIASAKDFLVNKFQIPVDQLEFSNFTYLEKEEDSNEFHTHYVPQEQAQIYQTNFTYKPTSLKMVTTRPEDAPIFVRMSPDGEVIEARAYKFDNIQTTPTHYQLIPVSELENHLDNATVMSLDRGSLILQEIDSQSISNIDVDSISLAYLFNPTNRTVLQPVYVLSGTATFKYGTTTEVVLYLPAIAN